MLKNMLKGISKMLTIEEGDNEIAIKVRTNCARAMIDNMVESMEEAPKVALPSQSQAYIQGDLPPAEPDPSLDDEANSARAELLNDTGEGPEEEPPE